MKIIITFSILCALFLSNLHSKNNWKQISGRGASSQSFFNQNDKAKVIWGYENGLWRVACYDRCTELTDKYLPLENLKDDVGYWVNFESVAPTEDISTGLVGEWDITLKSSSPWDNTSAVLNVSNQYSSTLTGHPIVISEFGVKGKDPVSKFEISNIQVIEDTLLQIDYMLYREVPKTQEELTEALPEEIRAEMTTINDKLKVGIRQPYVPNPSDAYGSIWNGFNFVKFGYFDGRHGQKIVDIDYEIITQEKYDQLTQRLEEIKNSYALAPINDPREASSTHRWNNIDPNIRCDVRNAKYSYSGKNTTTIVETVEINSLFYKENHSLSFNNLTFPNGLYSESGQAVRERVARLEQLTGKKYKSSCEPNDDYYNLIPSFKSSYFNILKNESKRIILQVRDGVFLILKKK